MRIVNLINLILKYELKKGCELGTHNGDLLFALLDNIPFLSMTGVDIWENQDSSVYDEYQYVDWARMYQNVLCRAEIYGKERVQIIKGLTSDVACRIKDESFDFIFIDANHSYEAVKQDILLWTPKVTQLGLITGHDLGREGINRALDEIFGLKNVSVLGEIWYIQRE